MDSRIRYSNILVDFGDGWKTEDFPFTGLAGHEAGQIIRMEPLHNDDDRAGAFVIETGQQGVLEPFIAGVALGVGMSVVGLERIVDDDQVASTSGQRAADRKSPAETL
jgi:hypothetical protein